jgi:hypothetical protein
VGIELIVSAVDEVGFDVGSVDPSIVLWEKSNLLRM